MKKKSSRFYDKKIFQQKMRNWLKRIFLSIKWLKDFYFHKIGEFFFHKMEKIFYQKMDGEIF